MEKFLETQNLLGLNHDEINNLNRSSTNKDTESTVKTFNKAALDLMFSLANSTKHLKKN